MKYLLTETWYRHITADGRRTANHPWNGRKCLLQLVDGTYCIGTYDADKRCFVDRDGLFLAAEWFYLFTQPERPAEQTELDPYKGIREYL